MESRYSESIAMNVLCAAFVLIAFAGLSTKQAVALDCRHYSDDMKWNCYSQSGRIFRQKQEAAKSPEQRQREAAAKDREQREFDERSKILKARAVRGMTAECNKLGGIACQLLWQSQSR